MIYSKDDPVVIEAIEFFKIDYSPLDKKYFKFDNDKLTNLVRQLYTVFDTRKDCLDYLVLSGDFINVLDYKYGDDNYTKWYDEVHTDGLRIMRERKALEDAIKFDCDKALEEVLKKRL